MDQANEIVELFDEDEAINAQFDESAFRTKNVIGHGQLEPQRAQAIPDNNRPYHNYKIITMHPINEEYVQQIGDVLYDALDNASDSEMIRDIKHADNYIEFQSTIAAGIAFFTNELNQFDADLQIVTGTQDVRLEYEGDIEIERVEDVAALKNEILRRLRTQNSIAPSRILVEYHEENYAEHNLRILIDVVGARRIEELGRRIRLFERDVVLTLVE